jgi:uncharacterized protein
VTRKIDAHFIAAGKYHDIDFVRLEMLKLLSEHPEIRTTVAMDYSDMNRIAACQFLVTYTCDLLPSEIETAALREFVENGGRWLALHGTNSILRFTDAGLVDTPEDRADVMDILGTQFKAHPPICEPFTVKILEKDHFLTRGFEDFAIIDELYLSKTVAPIQVLMQTSFTGEATGFADLNWDTDAVPVLYLRQLGKGAVLYNTLGHCRGHYDLTEMMPFYEHPERCAWNYPVYYEMLRRSILWSKGQPN